MNAKPVFVLLIVLICSLTAVASAAAPAEEKAVAPALVQPRKEDGDGTVAVSGELKQWHKVTLTLDGPFAYERDNAPNPFTDLAFNVAFTHENGSPKFNVPGYFAADGDAANINADSGTKWRAHLSPDKAGKWTWRISFMRGKDAAVSDSTAAAVAPFDGKSGEFEIAPSDKRDATFARKGGCDYQTTARWKRLGVGAAILCPFRAYPLLS